MRNAVMLATATCLGALALAGAAATAGTVATAGAAKKPIGGAGAGMTRVVAVLNAGQERPHPKGPRAGANGTFAGTLAGSTLKWRLTFDKLSGPATAAHIHSGAKGTAGPVSAPLCGPCTSPAAGSVTLTAQQLAALKAGGLYVNVHTTANPGGEIRGQLSVKARGPIQPNRY